jgi:hypothetical protein
MWLNWSEGKMLLLTENKDTDLMDTAAEIPYLETPCFNRLSFFVELKIYV